MQLLTIETLKKYKILKVRMKISYIAFVKNMTVHELFYRTILKSYASLVQMGVIEEP